MAKQMCFKCLHKHGETHRQTTMLSGYCHDCGRISSGVTLTDQQFEEIKSKEKKNK
jgi:hypothetical protein